MTVVPYEGDRGGLVVTASRGQAGAGARCRQGEAAVPRTLPRPPRHFHPLWRLIRWGDGGALPAPRERNYLGSILGGRSSVWLGCKRRWFPPAEIPA